MVYRLFNVETPTIENQLSKHLVRILMKISNVGCLADAWCGADGLMLPRQRFRRLAVRIIRSLISVDGFMFPRRRFHASLLTVSCFLVVGFMCIYRRLHISCFAALYTGFVLPYRTHDTASVVASTRGRSWRASACFLLAPSPWSEALRSCRLPTYCLWFHVDSLSVSFLFHDGFMLLCCRFRVLFCWRFLVSLKTVLCFLADGFMCPC